MQKPGSFGESSCKRQENGDARTGSDRPLKKARFPWQIKGKHHLKNEKPATVAAAVANTNECVGAESSCSRNHTSDLVGNTEQNLEILGDYLLKQDFNALDSVITNSDSILKPCPNVSLANHHYPKYISSSSSNLTSSSSSNKARVDVHPLSLTPSYVMQQVQILNEDKCIAFWQTKQMAKCFVDNTINRVLDSWMVSPLPAEMYNHVLALEVADFINNLPAANTVENEGILMAISAHGLQNTVNVNNSRAENFDISNVDNYVSHSTINRVFPSPPSSPESSDDEVEPLQKKEMEVSNNNQLSLDSPSMSDSPTLDQTDTDDNTYSNQQMFSSLTDNTNGDDHITNHFDFMNAAVSFAIQNKGLTSYSTDYG